MFACAKGANDTQGALEIVSYADCVETPKPHLNVQLLVDTSGSMSMHQEFLRLSCKTVTSLLPLQSSLRCITFNKTASEFVSPTVLKTVEDKANVMKSFDALKVSSWGTNIEVRVFCIRLLNLASLTSLFHIHHLQAVLQESAKGLSSDINIVILLSDGCANSGLTATQDLSWLAKSLWKGHGPIVCTCIGFNAVSELDTSLLASLCSMTDGTLHIARSREKILEAFGDVIGDIQSLVTMNVQPPTDCNNVEITSHVFKDKLAGIHLRDNVPRYVSYRVADALKPSTLRFNKEPFKFQHKNQGNKNAIQRIEMDKALEEDEEPFEYNEYTLLNVDEKTRPIWILDLIHQRNGVRDNDSFTFDMDVTSNQLRGRQFSLQASQNMYSAEEAQALVESF